LLMEEESTKDITTTYLSDGRILFQYVHHHDQDFTITLAFS